MEVVW